MYIFNALFIGSSNINFFEVMDPNFQIPSDNLDINDDFLLFCSSQSVPIFLVGHNSIRKHVIGTEFNLVVFGLRMQSKLGLLFGCYFDEKDAFGTRLLGNGGHFIGNLRAGLFGLLKTLKAVVYLLSFAEFCAVVWKSSVPANFKIGLLTVVKVVEILFSC